MSLKTALETVADEVKHLPDWLKQIYRRNRELERWRAQQLTGNHIVTAEMLERPKSGS